MAHGLWAERDRPFAGTYVPLRYWHANPRVSSVMMEIHRDLYMDEEMGIETPGLQRMRELIVRVMRVMEAA